MRQAPRAWIDVEAFVEAALLLRAAELRVRVAAANRPVATARSRVVLEHLHPIARVAKLVRGGHAGDAGAEDQHRCAAWCAGEIDGTLAPRFGREAERGHRLVHRRAAGRDADHAQQSAPRHRRRRVSIRHRSPPGRVSGDPTLPSHRPAQRAPFASRRQRCTAPKKKPPDRSGGSFATAVGSGSGGDRGPPSSALPKLRES